MRDRFEGLIFGIFRYSILVQVSNSRVSVFSPLNWADSAHAFLPLKIVVDYKRRGLVRFPRSRSSNSNRHLGKPGQAALSYLSYEKRRSLVV